MQVAVGDHRAAAVPAAASDDDDYDDRDARPARSFDRPDRPARGYDRDERPARSKRPRRPPCSLLRPQRPPRRSYDRTERPARSYDRDARPARSNDRDVPSGPRLRPRRASRALERSRRPSGPFLRPRRPPRALERPRRAPRAQLRPQRPSGAHERPAKSYERPVKSFERAERTTWNAGESTDRPARTESSWQRPQREDRPSWGSRSNDRDDRPARSHRPDRDSHRSNDEHDDNGSDNMSWTAQEIAPEDLKAVGTENGFAKLGLPKQLVSALASQNVAQPFPIQEATIPDALTGRDVLGRGQTGCWQDPRLRSPDADPARQLRLAQQGAPRHRARPDPRAVRAGGGEASASTPDTDIEVTAVYWAVFRSSRRRRSCARAWTSSSPRRAA